MTERTAAILVHYAMAHAEGSEFAKTLNIDPITIQNRLEAIPGLIPDEHNPIDYAKALQEVVGEIDEVVSAAEAEQNGE